MNRFIFLWIITAFLLLNMTISCAVEHIVYDLYADKPDSWFLSDEGKRTAENVLSHQSLSGAWPTNTDIANTKHTGPPRKYGHLEDATIGEMRFIARMFRVTGEQSYKEAFIKGLDHILKAQYPNGGWPKSFPIKDDFYYWRHITINDNAIVLIMALLRDIAQKEEFGFVDFERRVKSQSAFDPALECILRCQIMVNGRLTAWCQQHDERTYEPRWGRSFEPAAISGSESVGVIRMLMSIENPSEQIINAVNGACEWFDEVAIRNVRIEQKEIDVGVYQWSFIEDPEAKPVWARYYEIGTNRPIFCDRDGIIKYKIEEIGTKWMLSYGWYGYIPAGLHEEWTGWRKKHKLD